MKILCKNLRNSFLLFLATGAMAAAVAKDVALVSQTKGRCFAMKEGKLWELKGNESIADFSEITTEEGAQITLADNYGNKIHLSGSGQIKILNRLIELKRGYLWIQSIHPEHPLSVQTANSQSEIANAEAIVSFDSSNGKSQVLAVTGEVEFSNILESHLKLVLPPGHFSFVHADYEKGVPRKPTPVGYVSFKKVVGLFSGIRPLERNQKLFPEKEAAPGRAIASLIEMEEEQAPAQENKDINSALTKEPTERQEVATAATTDGVAEKGKARGKVIILKEGEDYKAVTSDFSAKKFLDNKIEVIKEKKRKANPYNKKTGVSVRIFGISGNAAAQAKRAPASALPLPMPVVKGGPRKMDKDLVMAPENYREPAETQRPVLEPFEKSLLQEYKYQMRHSNEVKDLIDELKSYDKDFKKDF